MTRLLQMTLSAFAATTLLSSCTPSRSVVSTPTASAQASPTAASMVIDADNLQSAQEAVAALQQVKASVEVGTNLLGYSQALVPAKASVDRYLAVDSTSELAIMLQASMSAHLVAVSWWRCDLEDLEESAKCRDKLIPQISALDESLKKKIDQAIAEKGTTTHPSYALDNDAILQVIWKMSGVMTDAANNTVQSQVK